MTATEQRSPPTDPRRDDHRRADDRASTARPDAMQGAREQRADAFTRERAEPQWNDPAAKAFQERHWQAAAQESKTPRRSSRLLLMAGIFVVGTTVGLAAALWLDNTTTRARFNTAVKSLPPAPASSSQLVQGEPRQVRGISRGELPYDGAPPPHEARQANELPAANVGEGGNAPAASASASSSGINDSQGQQEKAGKPDVAATQPEDKPKAHVKPVEKKTAKTAVKRRSTQAALKDKEIERIRQQAEEELKKKTSSVKVLETAQLRKGQKSKSTYSKTSVSTSSQSKGVSTRAMLARCERIQGLIAREKCKWRLCGGRWGKDGCPSYGPHTPSY